jgi:hypothetical protein
VENASISGTRSQRRLGIGVGGPNSPVANWVNSAYFESQALGGIMLGSFYNDMRFGAGSSRLTQMILKTDGKIGIGTTTPTVKLDVDGDINISSGSIYRVNGTQITAANILGLQTTLNNKAENIHSHGKVTSDGRITATASTPATDDRLVITRTAVNNEIANSTIQFNTTHSSQFLRKDGT